MSAVSVGGSCVSLLYATSNIKLISRPFHPITTPLGGLILGSGMYLTGACPGTIWAQIGVVVTDSLIVLAGGMAGSVCYSYIAKYLPVGAPGKFVHDLLGVPFLTVALPLFGGIIVTMAAIEYFQKKNTNQQVNWKPYVSGAIIGLLQIPAFYYMGTGLGTSSALLTIPGTFLRAVGITNPVITKYTSFTKNYWQVGLDAGIILGTYLYSKYYSKNQGMDMAESKQTSNPTVKFIGGFLLAMGARLADGCTSGHGLTGVANLSVTSIVAVAGMFGSGMALGVL